LIAIISAFLAIVGSILTSFVSADASTKANKEGMIIARIICTGLGIIFAIHKEFNFSFTENNKNYFIFIYF
jgi:hypothetical protein